MKKWTLREFFWKFKSAFFGLSDGTIFKILPRFFGFFAFLTPPNSAELVLKSDITSWHATLRALERLSLDCRTDVSLLANELP